MKGLLKYISPFAPDQSGAASVLYDLGGITVICDAGGCTGNICGFDEPRWFLRKSAIFSAGLRDMDAILGRDDKLIGKLKLVADKMDASFGAIIGTPVPAVIATDFRALKRMGEKRCGLPMLTIECTGTHLYDEGEESAYLELFDTFTTAPEATDEKAIGVIGATPLDLSSVIADEDIRAYYKGQGYERVYCYGMGDGIESVKKATTVSKNIVISPAGLKAAKRMNKAYGIPYETAYPIWKEELLEQLKTAKGKNVLVIHQQVASNALRDVLRKAGAADVTVASWFLLKPELKEKQDIHLKTEEQFTKLVESGEYDLVITDQLLMRAAGNYHGDFIHVPHFAVSGEYEHAR